MKHGLRRSNRREIILIWSRRNDVHRIAGRSAARNEVRLVAVMFKDQPEIIPTHAEIDGQFAGDFEIILNISTIIILAVVGQGNVGDEYVVGATDDNPRRPELRQRRDQQEACTARVVSAIAGIHDVSISTVVIEFTARPGWLQGGELHVLIFEAGLEGVLTVDLGEVVGNLKRGSDLVRRQERVAAQGLESLNAKGGETTVFSDLRNILDAVGWPEYPTGRWPAEKRGWCADS